MLETGKTYEQDGRKVLVFGITKNRLFEGADVTIDVGIGVNLRTGMIESVEHFTARVVNNIYSLDDDELENLGYYNRLYKAIMKSKIISISGKARTGKDTLANYLNKKASFKKIALSEPIKEVSNIIFGKSNKKYRERLIMIGEGLRSQDPNIWIKVWLRRAIDYASYDGRAKIVVSDVRQPNEFEFFKSLGAVTIRIDSDENKRRQIILEKDGEEALDEKLLNDETESYVSGFDTELVLFNNYDQSFLGEMESVLAFLKKE